MSRVPGELQPLLARSLSSAEDVELDTRTRLRTACTLSVVVCAYFMSYVVCHAEIGPYIYNKVSSEYNNSHMSSEHPCSPNMTHNVGNTSGEKIQNEIQQRVASLELHLGLTTFITATIPVIFLGPITDRYGRKIGFLFPATGTLLKVIAYCCIVTFDLSLNLLFLAHVFEAAGGGFAAMLTTMFSVISDITIPGPQRALHITIMEAMQTLVSSFTQIGVGQWIKSSFNQPLYFALGTGLVSLVAATAFPTTILVSPSTIDPGAASAPGVPGTMRGMLRLLYSCLKMPKKSFLLYVKDSGGRLTKRRLCLAVFILTVAVNFCKGGIWNLYRMKYPLCWSSSFLLIFNGTQMVCNWVVILLFLTLFRKVFNMADRHIAVIGCLSSLASLVFGALATNNVMVYEAVALGVMVRAIIPMLRSMLSSQVENSQQGALYAGMGVVETLGAGLFGLLAINLYSATIETFPGSVFLMFAALMVVALILLGVFHVVETEETRQELTSTIRDNDSIQDIH